MITMQPEPYLLTPEIINVIVQGTPHEKKAMDIWAKAKLHDVLWNALNRPMLTSNDEGETE